MTMTLEQLNEMMKANGGDLWLSGTNITKLPDGLTVGGTLWLEGTNITRLKDGDYVPNKYLYADGILTHVKKKKKIDKYTYYIGKINGRNVVSDGKNYAHCVSFKRGVADLAFKEAKDRGAEQYKNLTLDSRVSTDKAIEMYRVITGACEEGTNMFVSEIKELKESYTIQEIIDITKGSYGSSVFADFFRSNKHV